MWQLRSDGGPLSSALPYLLAGCLTLWLGGAVPPLEGQSKPDQQTGTAAKGTGKGAGASGSRATAKANAGEAGARDEAVDARPWFRNERLLIPIIAASNVVLTIALLLLLVMRIRSRRRGTESQERPDRQPARGFPRAEGNFVRGGGQSPELNARLQELLLKLENLTDTLGPSQQRVLGLLNQRLEDLSVEDGAIKKVAKADHGGKGKGGYSDPLPVSGATLLDVDLLLRDYCDDQHLQSRELIDRALSGGLLAGPPGQKGHRLPLGQSDSDDRLVAIQASAGGTAYAVVVSDEQVFPQTDWSDLFEAPVEAFRGRKVVRTQRPATMDVQLGVTDRGALAVVNVPDMS